jgi:SAM-dependent methyltransferase
MSGDHDHDHEHHEHATSSQGMERYCDVAVIGASADALAVALHHAELGRSVIVVDATGDTALETGREGVRRHGVEVLSGHATAVDPAGAGGFRVTLTGGHTLVARTVLTDDAHHDNAHQDNAHQDNDVSITLPDGASTELLDAPATSANQLDWDHRYSGDQLWSGNPNGTLVNEVVDLTPGRALDVGAGEGGDAVWLAEHGWQVTASDISERALDRIAAAAAHRGVAVVCLHADANAVDAFGTHTFDLVSAQYASIPRTPDGRGVANLLGAVAPGGTLLVVGHDLEPMRAPHDPLEWSRPFDPDAYVRVDDVLGALTDDPEWEIDVHELRNRPPGAASGSHHHNDVVLRARRSLHS